MQGNMTIKLWLKRNMVLVLKLLKHYPTFEIFTIILDVAIIIAVLKDFSTSITYVKNIVQELK